MENCYIDYSKLKGRIIEKYGRQKDFISKIDMTEPTFIKKINNGSYFRQDEIIKMLDILDISLDNVKEFFYDVKVRKNLTN